MDFVAIDVETANADMASICQIGIATYSNGLLIDEWSTLVDPEDYFDQINIDVHGLDENTVCGSPTFAEVEQIVTRLLVGSVCVSHTHFDRVSLSRVYEKYQLEMVNSVWLDSAMVARRAWPEFSRKGYGLKNICEKIGYSFKHHDALEDAKASGVILVEAGKETGLDLAAWQLRVRKPINPENSSSGAAINRDGDSEGKLFGEVVVFTGALEISRAHAANLASSIGCDVTSNVTKKTTLLVVGDQDVTKLAGKTKSAKHLKAEKLIMKGQGIRIVKESDFQKLVVQAIGD